MRKKDLIIYALILVLVLLFLWQWLSKGSLISQLNMAANHNAQMQFLTGIGQLGSAHLHADVKVYINGQSIDFSQRKYQLASSFLHFEEGIGDVIHTHATGLTIGHLLRSLGMDFNNNCIVFEKKDYCNENGKRLKFYVNGQPNNEFDNKVIRNLDKYLISYGSETDSETQKQLSSVTNLAPRYSSQGKE
ncbi:hypothetical protein HYY71_06995 [Candidatus Woesearchaeota archaeon]|nr:hypothetical protein [Candidatus Woesearchaeota archaeon]